MHCLKRCLALRTPAAQMSDYVDDVVVTAVGPGCCAMVEEAWHAAGFNAGVGLVLHTEKSVHFASSACGRAALSVMPGPPVVEASRDLG